MDRLWKKSLLCASSLTIGYSANQKYQVKKLRMTQYGAVPTKPTNENTTLTLGQKLQALMPYSGKYTGSSLGLSSMASAESRDNLIETILSTEFDPTSLDGLPSEKRVKYDFEMKSRNDHLKKLKDSSVEFDLLIIGGGANGAGVVLDAASRGLNCAVIDSYDFAAGTSSKSTKMAHGGIRYFQ